MKPAVWRIFQNGRWSYSDTPSTRHQDRAAWQPLYAQSEKEWVGLTLDEAHALVVEQGDWPVQMVGDLLVFAAEAKLKEKNGG